jgi:sec-independent protein translocase protein TatB
MFGIDFSEILVIFGIALVVLGPERLPKLAATIGRWLGRARAMARQFREQLEQEAGRLQHEAKDVHNSLDLNAAVQRSAQDPPAASGSNSPGSPNGTVPTQEFGLHNAGAPESAASAAPAPHAAPAAAPKEAPVAAVEADER